MYNVDTSIDIYDNKDVQSSPVYTYIQIFLLSIKREIFMRSRSTT